MSVWDDVVGQEQAVATLRAAATDPAAMTHAWLLTGPPGSGRSNAARAFAAALQCEQGGCGRCQACRTTLAGTHPDVTLVATELVTIKIDDVRDLVTVASRSPSQGRRRVIVVEDADRMAERTTNVLLKAIEEPAPHTVWILCAPSPQDVLVTIRSRCRGVVLRVPPVEAVAGLLVQRDGVDEHVALVAARAAQSHIGLARRLARDAARASAARRCSRSRGGSAGWATPCSRRRARGPRAGRGEGRDGGARRRGEGRAPACPRRRGRRDAPPRLRSQLRDLEADQKRRATRHQRDVLDRAMVDLLSLYRDVLVVQLGAQVELVNSELAETVRALAEDSTPEQTVRRMDAIGVARERLEGNVAPLLAVEAMVVALRPQG